MQIEGNMRELGIFICVFIVSKLKVLTVARYHRCLFFFNVVYLYIYPH